MATVSYAWATVAYSYFLNDRETLGDQHDPTVTAMKKGFFAAWGEPSDGGINGRIGPANDQPPTSEFEIDTSSAIYHHTGGVAGLNNGRAVAVWDDVVDDHDVRGRMFQKDGTPVSLDFGISTGALEDSDAAVAALADGGFVVTWTRANSGGDNDIIGKVFNANGTERSDPIGVNSDTSLSTFGSAVAGLADGGFVTAWIQEPLAGGDNEVWYRRVDENGDAVDLEPQLIEGFGTSNNAVDVIGLQDGGFAMVWSGDGWGTGSNEVSLSIRNANGSYRANGMVNLDNTVGDQARPSLTQLSNGFIVVSWVNVDANTLTYQVFDAAGERVGVNTHRYQGTVNADIAALAGNGVINVRNSTAWETGGDATSGLSIRTSVEELVRTTTGGGAAEVLNGDNLSDSILGLGGKDKLSGFGGKDSLDGGGGDDVLRGGGDRDQLIGGEGADRFIYSDVSQSRVGLGADGIRGFEHGVDRFDVEAIDAKAGKGGDQAFVLIQGAFTAEGQIRVLQSGKDAIIQFNTTGPNGADMEILLKNFDSHDISAADFVL